MLKTDAIKLQGHELIDRLRSGRLRIARCVENLLEILQRNFGLTVNIDDVAQFLQRRKNKEGIDHEREKLPNRNLLAEYQVQHQKQDTGAQGIHGGSLNKTQAAQILHLFELALHNFA